MVFELQTLFCHISSNGRTEKPYHRVVPLPKMYILGSTVTELFELQLQKVLGNLTEHLRLVVGPFGTLESSLEYSEVNNAILVGELFFIKREREREKEGGRTL